MTDISNEKTSLCSGYCTLTLGLHTMTKGCNETLPTDALGINMSLGLAYPNDLKFTSQVSSLELVCNKPNCNSNESITEVIAIANAFLTAQSIGIRDNPHASDFVILLFYIIKLKIKNFIYINISSGVARMIIFCMNDKSIYIFKLSLFLKRYRCRY